MVVLIVFSFMMLFGYSFYIKSQEAALNEQFQSVKTLRMIGISQIVSLPELRCNDYSTKNCFDYYKLLAFHDLMKESDAHLFYTSKFGNSLITIRDIYPDDNEITVFNNTPKNYKSAYASNIAVNIYNVSSDSYSLAILTLKVYS